MKPLKASYTERLSEIQYQSLKFWIYLGAALGVIALAFKFYSYLTGE